MMRAPTSFAVVVRRKDGTLLVRERGMLDARAGWAKWPLVRGIASLVESLRLGSEALRFSSDLYIEDLEAEERREAAASGKSGATPSKPPVDGVARSSLLALSAARVLSALTLFLLSVNDGAPTGGPGARAGEAAQAKTEKASGAGLFMLVIVVAFFIALPQLATAGANRALHLGLEVQSPRFQLLTGTFKLTIVVGYLLFLRYIPYIRRTFQFHGAEHKTISTYEAGEELVLANARGKTTLHPRCGTTFLVMIALVSDPRVHGDRRRPPANSHRERGPRQRRLLPREAPVPPVHRRDHVRDPALLREVLHDGPAPRAPLARLPRPEDHDGRARRLAARGGARCPRAPRSSARGLASPRRTSEPADVAFPSYEALAAASQLRAGRRVRAGLSSGPRHAPAREAGAARAPLRRPRRAPLPARRARRPQRAQRS